jgi:hypothetical protein
VNVRAIPRCFRRACLYWRLFPSLTSYVNVYAVMTHMRRVRSMVALALLALWLPATLHCELEWVGVFGDCAGCHEQSDAVAQDNDADGCAIAEKGTDRLPRDAALSNMPEPAPWVAALLVIALSPRELATTGASITTAAPLETIRAWQFVARAAPRSRAPALMG